MAEFAQHTVNRVRTSFAKIADDPLRAGQVFYHNLFRISPETREMFPDDIGPQSEKLIATLDLLVVHLDNWDEIAEAVADLARFHAGLGVTAEDYEPVGRALLAMLSDLRGDAFGEDERMAWAETYTAVSSAMIDAAHRTA